MLYNSLGFKQLLCFTNIGNIFSKDFNIDFAKGTSKPLVDVFKFNIRFENVE